LPGASGRRHTFYSEGDSMKIWNATVRKGQHGPFILDPAAATLQSEVKALVP
jgi:hypothetical protein